MYIIGIDYGHGETAAAYIEINEELYEQISQLKQLRCDNQPTESHCGATLNIEEESDSSKENEKAVEDGGEWNAAIIRRRLEESFHTLRDMKIKGETKSIKSIIAYDWKRYKWIIGPNDTKLKSCISNLESERGQAPAVAAYFKGVLVDGKGEECHSNNLSKISETNKDFFGLFIKKVLESIVESNDLIHSNPRNYRLYVACPSEWDKDQIESFYQFLRDNDIPCEEVIEESRAAYMSFRNTILGNVVKGDDNPGVLVIDFGSSTVDFTYFGGKEAVNYGYQIGAQKVEQILFDYMLNNERTAKEAFDLLARALDNNEMMAKNLLIYALRKKKEQFYLDLAENDEATLEAIDLKTIVTPHTKTGIKFTNEQFGFDAGDSGYNLEQINKILNLEKYNYISEVESAFKSFKDRDDVGQISYVILTGGASRMDFVKKLAKKVYGVNKDTLICDDDPTFSISRGIAKYGTYRTLSEPIRQAIESTLNSTWRDFYWVKEVLKDLIPNLVQQVYKDRLNSTIDEWAKPDSQIVSHKDNNLYDVIDEIIKEKKDNDPMQIWQNIEKSKEFFNENQHSFHALLRVIYDDIELRHKENRDEINKRLNIALTEKVNEQVKVLFAKYISIFYDPDRLSPDTSLPQFYDINVFIENPKKKKLLVDLIEKVFIKIDASKLCKQDAFSFNYDRNADFGISKTRSSLSAPIKEVMDEFCKTIHPTFDIEKISISCKNCVDTRYAEIKEECEKEPYTLGV